MDRLPEAGLRATEDRLPEADLQATEASSEKQREDSDQSLAYLANCLGKSFSRNTKLQCFISILCIQLVIFFLNHILFLFIMEALNADYFVIILIYYIINHYIYIFFSFVNKVLNYSP